MSVCALEPSSLKKAMRRANFALLVHQLVKPRSHAQRATGEELATHLLAMAPDLASGMSYFPRVLPAAEAMTEIVPELFLQADEGRVHYLSAAYLKKLAIILARQRLGPRANRRRDLAQAEAVATAEPAAPPDDPTSVAIAYRRLLGSLSEEQRRQVIDARRAGRRDGHHAGWQTALAARLGQTDCSVTRALDRLFVICAATLGRDDLKYRKRRKKHRRDTNS